MDAAVLEKIFKRTGLYPLDQPRAVAKFGQAREAFNAFVSMDAPDLPPATTDALQVQLLRWQTAMFGIPKPCEIACGIAEELGERTLADATAAPYEDIEDAVGDVMIYATQLASARRLTIADCIAAGHPETGLQFFRFPNTIMRGEQLLRIACGYLSHVQLKAEQNIRGMQDAEVARFGTFLGLAMLMRGLWLTHGYAHGVRAGGDILHYLETTAKVVLARDWRKDANAGGEAKP